MEVGRYKLTGPLRWNAYITTYVPIVCVAVVYCKRRVIKLATYSVQTILPAHLPRWWVFIDTMQCVFCLDGLSLNLSGRQFSFDLGPTNQTQAGSDHVQYPHDSHSAGPGHQTGASGPQLPYSLLSFKHMIYQPSAARCPTSQPLTAAQVVARSRPICTCTCACMRRG